MTMLIRCAHSSYIDAILVLAASGRQGNKATGKAVGGQMASLHTDELS